jgi:hypothetical protein
MRLLVPIIFQLIAGLAVSAQTISFKLNENGDPTNGGTHPEWTASGSSYQKTTDALLAVYDVDVNGDSTNDVSVELSSPTSGAGHLLLSGASGAGITLDGNGSGGINADEVLRLRFGSDVVINGFVLSAFGAGESADYSANGGTWTTTNATVSGRAISLPAGSDFDLFLTNPSGSDAFRLRSIQISLPAPPPDSDVSFKITNHQARFEWTGYPYTNYQLEHCTDLAANVWTNLGEALSAPTYVTNIFTQVDSNMLADAAFYRVRARTKTPAEVTGIPDGISIRIIAFAHPFQGPGGNSIWALGTNTAQNVLEIIEDLKPNMLDRFMTGRVDPTMSVPVRAGEPPMNVLEFMNAALAAAAPDCIITPKLNLKWQWSKVYGDAILLRDMALTRPIRVINLDLYPYFWDTNTPAYVEARMQDLVDLGVTIGGNFTGGIDPTFGLQNFGIFNVQKDNGFLPNYNALDRLKDKPELEKFYLYIDYPGAMDAFTALPVDEQADIYYNIIHPGQEEYGYEYVYTIMQDGWDARNSYTSTNGPYGGKSMYDITKELINLTRGTP